MIKLITIAAIMAAAIHYGCEGFDALQSQVTAETAAFQKAVNEQREY